MQNIVVINNQEVEFEVVGDQTYTTSKDIASVFEKRHDNIIAQIKSLPRDNFNALNFKVVQYKDEKGELRPMYKLTRDGFSLLVMGFTGAKAYKWKIDFILAFNKMESYIKEQSNSQPLWLISKALETMLTQQATILKMMEQNSTTVKNEFVYIDRPSARMAHRRLSNEEKFIARIIKELEKGEGLKQGELLERVGRYKNDKTALRWLHSYDGIYWRANVTSNTYSYSLIEEV